MIQMSKTHKIVADVVIRANRLAISTALVLVFASASYGGTFVALGPTNIVRASGGPNTVTSQFTLRNSKTSYTLRINNGGLQGEFPRVSSAVILLNGVQVAGPSDFNRNVNVIEKTITVGNTNALSVELRSAPGSGLAIQIIGVDNDLPMITASVTPSPNGSGWNNSNVTITFTCSDATSGIANCPSPITVTTEGAGRTVSGTAVDRAGNSASTLVTLNIDKTAPKILISSPLDLSTVSSSPITVSGTLDDSGATVLVNGVAANVDAGTFTAAGVPLQNGTNIVTATAIDRAGNVGTASIQVTLGPPLNDSLALFQRLDATPITIESGDPTSVVVRAWLAADSSFIAGSVTLWRYDQNGNVLANLGQMFDDGTHGDQVTGDKVFTTTITLNEAGPAIVTLRASADIAPQQTVYSSDSLIPISVLQGAQEARVDLASNLRAGNLAAAYNKLGNKFNGLKVLDSLPLNLITGLADAVSSCSVVEQNESLEICVGPIVIDGQIKQLRFFQVKDALGLWRIIGW